MNAIALFYSNSEYHISASSEYQISACDTCHFSNCENGAFLLVEATICCRFYHESEAEVVPTKSLHQEITYTSTTK